VGGFMSENDVLLLHGLSKSKQIMQEMEKFLNCRGYCCHNIGYDSTHLSIDDCAKSVAKQLEKSRVGRENYPLDVVGHSLGGLVAWALILEICPDIKWNRVVMLGTPIQGSILVKNLSRFSFYRRSYGPAAIEIAGYGKKLRPIDKICGVIAGTRSSIFDRIFVMWLRFKGHDGKILVEETKVEGMTDFLEFPAAHAQLPKVPGIILQTFFFLQKGKFAKKDKI
jgi:pimeloyl-ACP methyl ester carboxylesterase